MKNEDEAKLVEKEKVKLLVVLVLMLAGVGVAFEVERASRPQAEATVVVYENGVVAEKLMVERDEVAVSAKVLEPQKEVVVEPEMAKVSAKEADAFFDYLKEIDGKLYELERREAVLDKIEVLKSREVEEPVDNKRNGENLIEVYDNAGEVTQVIEDKADEAAEEAAVLSEVLGEEAEEPLETEQDIADESEQRHVEAAIDEAREKIDVLSVDEGNTIKATALVSENDKESDENNEPFENTDKSEVSVDSEGAIDMMKGIIEREAKKE